METPLWFAKFLEVLKKIWALILDKLLVGLDKFWFSLLGFAVKFFSFFAVLISAIVAFYAVIWFVTLQYTNYVNYYDYVVFETIDGNCLRVEYPKVVLINSEQAYIKFTFSCETKQPEVLKIFFSNELGLPNKIENGSGSIERIKFFVGQLNSPQTYKLPIVNSGNISRGRFLGVYYYGISQIKINSEYLPKPQIINIHVESVQWAVLREFTQIPIDDKSILFLLISGVIPSAVAYFSQLLKDLEQKRREDSDKYSTNLLDKFSKNPVFAVSEFVADCQKYGVKTYSSHFSQLEAAGCHKALRTEVFIQWKSDPFSDANQVIKDIKYLDDKFGLPSIPKEGELLEQLGEILKPERNDSITKTELEIIKKAYRTWGDDVKQLLLPIIQRSVRSFNDLGLVYSILGGERKFGIQLLKDANIYDTIDAHVKKRYDYQEAIESSTEWSDIEKEGLILTWKTNADSATALKAILKYDINRPHFGQRRNLIPSDEIQKWLSFHNCDQERYSFGDELAELDYEFSQRPLAENPVFRHIEFEYPTLVFSDLGMGKTATAYYLYNKCLPFNVIEHPKIFPIYTKYQIGQNAGRWLIDTVAGALTEFVACNPRHFLNAESPKRAALGRLMLLHAGTIDRLQMVFRTSGHTGNDEWSQILSELRNFKNHPFPQKINFAEAMDILYLAKPDRFQAVYLILDIGRVSLTSANTEFIRELIEFTIPLVQIDFILKAFLPKDLKKEFDRSLIESVGTDLTWTNEQLNDLLSVRFFDFKKICDLRSVPDPYKLIVDACSGSPREAIRFGNALLRHGAKESHLGKSSKLNKDSFSYVKRELITRGALSNTGGGE